MRPSTSEAANVEVLADGYQLVEGPRVDGDGNVWFTDVLGGGVHRWSAASSEVETVVPKRRGVGGLALHADGGVVVSGRDITHAQPDGTNRLLFAPPEGVTGFNDIAATIDGAILAGGLRFRPFAGDEVEPGAFWHITAPETASLVLDDVDWPNGVGDDGSTWRFCDYHRGTVTVMDHGGGSDRRVLATPTGEADGLAFDDDGGMWVAQPRSHSLVRFARERRRRPHAGDPRASAGQRRVRRRCHVRDDDRVRGHVRRVVARRRRASQDRDITQPRSRRQERRCQTK